MSGKAGNEIKRAIHYLLLIIFLFNLNACGEIDYTPSVVPLELGTIDPNQQIPESPVLLPALNSIEPMTGLNSEQAIGICTEGLSWGDAAAGGCLQPGGLRYYIWIEPDKVIEIELNTSDPNQSGFLAAADQRAASIEDFHDDVRLAIIGVFAFGFEIPLALLACTTIWGCALGGGALALTGYGISEVGDSIIEDIASFEIASIRMEYYYCRIQGNSDNACREALDMNVSELEEPDE